MPETPPPHTHRHPRLATILSARSAYVAIILIATLTNLEPNWHDGLAGQRLARALHPPIGWDDTIDAVRNIVLFAGFGAVWEVTTRLRLRTALWRATLYGFLLSATVETLQLFSPARFASILDVITNTSGTFLGAFAVAVMVASVRARRQTSKYLGVPVFVFALGLLGTIAMEAGTPVVRQGYISVASASPIDKLRATLAAAGPLSFASVGASEICPFDPRWLSRRGCIDGARHVNGDRDRARCDRSGGGFVCLRGVSRRLCRDHLLGSRRGPRSRSNT